MSFGVEETARRLGHYAWIEMRLFEMLGAWASTVPEVEVKVLLGTQATHHAWHAEVWRQRMPVLGSRGPDELTAPPNDALVAFVDALGEPAAPDQTIEKLTGVYRVLVPAKLATYTAHLDGTGPVADAPIARALRQVVTDEMDDWRGGERALQSLLRTRDELRRAARRQLGLQELLLAAGGIAGPDSLRHTNR